MKRSSILRQTSLKKTPIRRKRKEGVRVTKDGRTILSGRAYTALRIEVYERDEAICKIKECGKPVFWEDYEMDHWLTKDGKPLISRGMGGSQRHDSLETCRTAHRWCNRGRLQRERPIKREIVLAADSEALKRQPCGRRKHSSVRSVENPPPAGGAEMTPERVNEIALKTVSDRCRVKDQAAVAEHRKYVANGITVAVLEAEAAMVERFLTEWENVIEVWVDGDVQMQDLKHRIEGLSPDPGFLERVRNEARLQEAQWWRSLVNKWYELLSRLMGDDSTAYQAYMQWNIDADKRIAELTALVERAAKGEHGTR